MMIKLKIIFSTASSCAKKLFDNTYNLQYNLTRSARVNFTSSTSRIIRNCFNDQNEDYKKQIYGIIFLTKEIQIDIFKI